MADHKKKLRTCQSSSGAFGMKARHCLIGMFCEIGVFMSRFNGAICIRRPKRVLFSPGNTQQNRVDNSAMPNSQKIQRDPTVHRQANLNETFLLRLHRAEKEFLQSTKSPAEPFSEPASHDSLSTKNCSGHGQQLFCPNVQHNCTGAPSTKNKEVMSPSKCRGCM